MSTQPEPEYVEEEVSETTICDYLAAHPDFFERHLELLEELQELVFLNYLPLWKLPRLLKIQVYLLLPMEV